MSSLAFDDLQEQTQDVVIDFVPDLKVVKPRNTTGFEKAFSTMRQEIVSVEGSFTISF